jgi:DMSO/TMAO reductase YedYZ molybdopterin-dependent catalytic subunit
MPRPASTDSTARVGLVAGLVATAAGQVVAATSARGRAPASGLARGLVDAAPGALVDGGVALVGHADKAGLAAIATGVNGLAAVAGAALATRSPALGVVAAAAPHAAGGLLALRHGDASRRGTLLATLSGMALAATAVAPVRVRRGVALATSMALVGGVATLDRRARRRDRADLNERVTLPRVPRPLPPVPAGTTDSDGVAPLLSRPGDFPVIDVTVPEPRVDLEAWRLELDGEVGTPLSLGVDELLALPLEERDLLLVCVHNTVGGRRMGCARWTGIGLADLLDRAGAPEDGWLVVEAVDGYSNVIAMPVARAHGFLAVGMAGEPLPREHGSPARLLVPGLTGQDGNTKWLRRMTVAVSPPPSYWGRRGWIDGTYPVHPASRIDSPGQHARVEPGEVCVRGYAWAPPVGVDAVQLQVDEGPWVDAELGADLGPDAWRPWTAPWQAMPGTHRLRVRCRTTTGHWQEEAATTPYPQGVRGVHAVTVQVGGGSGGPAARRWFAAATARLSWAARSVLAWGARE